MRRIEIEREREREKEKRKGKTSDAGVLESEYGQCSDVAAKPA
jgi:hypothetical protein